MDAYKILLIGLNLTKIGLKLLTVQDEATVDRLNLTKIGLKRY